MWLARGSRQLDDLHQHCRENRAGARCQRHARNRKQMLDARTSRRGRGSVLRSTGPAQRPTFVIR